MINMKSVLQSLFVLFAWALVLTSQGTSVFDTLELSAKIVACSGCALRRRVSHVVDFLVNGEAEYYVGVLVEYIDGHEPIMTLYRYGEEFAQVDLATTSSKEELHELMREHGFKRKPEDIIAQNAAIVQRRIEEAKEERQEQERKKEEQRLRQENENTCNNKRQDTQTIKVLAVTIRKANKNNSTIYLPKENVTEQPTPEKYSFINLQPKNDFVKINSIEANMANMVSTIRSTQKSIHIMAAKNLYNKIKNKFLAMKRYAETCSARFESSMLSDAMTQLKQNLHLKKNTELFLK